MNIPRTEKTIVSYEDNFEKLTFNLNKSKMEKSFKICYYLYNNARLNGKIKQVIFQVSTRTYLASIVKRMF